MSDGWDAEGGALIGGELAEEAFGDAVVVASCEAGVPGVDVMGVGAFENEVQDASDMMGIHGCSAVPNIQTIQQDVSGLCMDDVFISVQFASEIPRFRMTTIEKVFRARAVIEKGKLGHTGHDNVGRGVEMGAGITWDDGRWPTRPRGIIKVDDGGDGIGLCGGM